MRLIAGGGGFAPFLHKAVLEMEAGDEREVSVPPKDAFGECELASSPCRECLLPFTFHGRQCSTVRGKRGRVFFNSDFRWLTYVRSA